MPNAGACRRAQACRSAGTRWNSCIGCSGTRPRPNTRMAVIRAAKAVAKRHKGVEFEHCEKAGRELIFFHHDNLMSYSIFRIRSDRMERWVFSDEDARKVLSDKRHAELMAEGGSWWLF